MMINSATNVKVSDESECMSTTELLFGNGLCVQDQPVVGWLPFLLFDLVHGDDWHKQIHA
jgi:hypothetical protein